jgi:hypothetical protein
LRTLEAISANLREIGWFPERSLLSRARFHQPLLQILDKAVERKINDLPLREAGAALVVTVT